MQIHNFFSDTLLSIRTLFDTIIFPPKYIKSYEFNIANRSFTLSKNDYTTQYPFPTAIINLVDDNYSFGERTNTIQHTTLSNFNQISVLQDSKPNGNIIRLQEEQTQIKISILVNCESQLESKEVEYRIKRNLPVNKYIQLFNFTSFLEIHPTILLTYDLDFNTRSIINLFNKLNKNTGNIEYCYAVNYKPLIKLDSISTSIQDSGQRSFPVNIELTYQIQMPIWLCLERAAQPITNINIDFHKFGNEPISENSVRPIYNNTIVDKYGNAQRYSIRNLLVHDLYDYQSSTITNEPDSPFTFKLGFAEDDFKILPDFEYDIFDIHGDLHKNVKPSLVDVKANSITFNFSITEIENYYRATQTTPIIIQFMINRINLDLSIE